MTANGQCDCISAGSRYAITEAVQLHREAGLAAIHTGGFQNGVRSHNGLSASGGQVQKQVFHIRLADLSILGIESGIVKLSLSGLHSLLSLGDSVGIPSAVQQLDAVEVGGVGDTVDFGLEVVNFLLEVGAVDLVVVGAVGGLGGQVIHAVEHILDFLHGALGGLHQGDAVLDVLGSGVQTDDLGAHLLRNCQTGGVVAGAVDLVAGRQLLQVLAQRAGVVVVVAVGVHRYNIMLNSHFVPP